MAISIAILSSARLRNSVTVLAILLVLLDLGKSFSQLCLLLSLPPLLPFRALSRPDRPCHLRSTSLRLRAEPSSHVFETRPLALSARVHLVAGRGEPVRQLGVTRLGHLGDHVKIARINGQHRHAGELLEL